MPASESASTSSVSIAPHWVRYGIAADQKYLLDEFADTYDQLVVNANMLAHMPSALSQFISQRARKPYVIDPQTHAFAQDLQYLLSDSKGSAGQIKRSWAKLLEAYGEEVKAILIDEDDARPLDPEDFADSAFCRSFTAHVIRFQRDSVTRELEEGEDRDYLEFLEQETGVPALSMPPTHVIAPYFFVYGPTARAWLQVNLQLLKEAKAFVGNQNWEQPALAAQVVISKEVLADATMVEEIISRYGELSPDAVFLWIDQFSEHEATRYELDNYLRLLSGFREQGLPVVNLFGGFFSVALMRFSDQYKGALAAVCHGLEYGENRPVIPLGGGMPVAKFYSRNLHHRLPPRIALREIRRLEALHNAKVFHRAICNCPNCRKIIKTNPEIELAAYFETKESTFWMGSRRVSREFPTASSSENCTRHYMWCKQWEYQELEETVGSVRERFQRADVNLRKVLGIIPQAPVLFSGMLVKNTC